MKCKIFFNVETNPKANLCDMCKNKKTFTFECNHTICLDCISKNHTPVIESLINYIKQFNYEKINSEDFVVRCPYPECKMSHIIPAECILDHLSPGINEISEYRLLLEYKLNGILANVEHIDGSLIKITSYKPSL